MKRQWLHKRTNLLRNQITDSISTFLHLKAIWLKKFGVKLFVKGIEFHIRREAYVISSILEITSKKVYKPFSISSHFLHDHHHRIWQLTLSYLQKIVISTFSIKILPLPCTWKKYTQNTFFQRSLINIMRTVQKYQPFALPDMNFPRYFTVNYTIF